MECTKSVALTLIDEVTSGDEWTVKVNEVTIAMLYQEADFRTIEALLAEISECCRDIIRYECRPVALESIFPSGFLLHRLTDKHREMHSAAESFSDLHKLAYSLAEKKKFNPDQSPTDLAFDLRFIDIIDDNGKLKPNPNGSESQSDR